MPMDPAIARRRDEAALAGPPDSPEMYEVLGRPYGPPVEGALIVENLLVAGPHGDVPVRRYGVPDAQERPALVWCHGGAFAYGDLEMPESDQTARAIALGLGSTVVAIDYRLLGAGQNLIMDGSPLPSDLTNRYPVAHDDIVAVWLWAQEQAPEWGVDPDRIALGGASAGANLISGVVLALHDRGLPLPSCWLPIYPLVHRALPPFSAELRAKLDEGGEDFTAEGIANLNGAYAPDADAPYAFAGDAGDLSGLLPVLQIDAEYDVLRASGERFAADLAEAGVDVTYVVEQGVPHGHLNLIGHPITLGSLQQMADFIDAH